MDCQVLCISDLMVANFVRKAILVALYSPEAQDSEWVKLYTILPSANIQYYYASLPLKSSSALVHKSEILVQFSFPLPCHSCVQTWCIAAGTLKENRCTISFSFLCRLKREAKQTPCLLSCRLVTRWWTSMRCNWAAPGERPFPLLKGPTRNSS